MHALAFLSLVASTALVAALQEEYASFQPLGTFGTLQARQQQSCASVGGKTCGSRCIRMSYTCCGNGAGACEAGYACGLGANGIYGCCPFGQRCRGDAPDPSTTDIGVARPTTVLGGGGGETTTRAVESTTRAVESTTQVVESTTQVVESTTQAVESTTQVAESTTRLLTPVTPTNTPARTTAVSGDDETTSSSTIVAMDRSTSVTRSPAVATSTSGSLINGSGSESNGNGNSNGSGSSGGGNNPQVSSAGVLSVGLASLAGGFIAAIASLL